MTDSVTVARPHEDRVVPAVIYGLYLFGPFTGFLSTLIGLVVAYANRGAAGERMETHYTLLIRTFWLSLAWLAVGVGLTIIGAILSLVVVGIPVLLAGLTILGVFGPLMLVWLCVRCGLGIMYLAQDEAYPRPMSWLF